MPKSSVAAVRERQPKRRRRQGDGGSSDIEASQLPDRLVVMRADGGGIRIGVWINDPDRTLVADGNGFAILSQCPQGRIVIGVGNRNVHLIVIERCGTERLTIERKRTR